jgi:hypothetical protein
LNLGYYSVISGVQLSGGSAYIDMYGIYGSDYDRVKNNNENLRVYYNIQGIRSGTARHSASNTDTYPGIKSVVKSGTLGSGRVSSLAGMYVGSITSGMLYTVATLKVEGGYIYNINGGPRIKFQSCWYKSNIY